MKILNGNASAVDAEELQKISEDARSQQEKDAEIKKDPDFEIPEMQAYLRIAADIDGVEPPPEWAAEVKNSILDDLEKAVLSKPGEQSASLEEAYIKAAAKNDEDRMAVIDLYNVYIGLTYGKIDYAI